jgi:N-acetylmuramoyl-L-alanine amidase
VGHWQNENMPEELKNLELNGGGASWAGLSEREVVLEISKMVQEKLQAEGVLVDLLPATVPKGYLADAFVSIHADGNTNAGVNGYKIAPPRRDYTGLSEALSAAIYETYGLATGLRTDPSVTRRMTAYYAFNWPRYEYAIHPMTPAVIVETGFLTSSVDREIIVNQPERAAVGITDGIMAFLNNSAKDLVPAPLEFTRPNLPISGVVRCAPLRAERLSRALEYDCLPSLTSKEGQNYLIEGYASSTLPVGTEIVVMGNYRAIQTAYNYFWFPYEVTGIITDSVIEFIEG